MPVNLIVGNDASNSLQGTAGADVIYGYNQDGPQSNASTTTGSSHQGFAPRCTSSAVTPIAVPAPRASSRLSPITKLHQKRPKRLR